MSGKPFEQMIDGEVFYCIAYGSEKERQAALKGGQISSPPAPAEREEPRPRGRPSCDGLIAGAVTALGTELSADLTLAERRRRVLRYLAQSGIDEADLPKRSTVETYLAAHPVAEKCAEKSPEKSGAHKIAG